MSNKQLLFLLISFVILVCFLTQRKETHAGKKRPAALLSFLGRSAAGLSFLHCFNLFCAALDIVTYVSLNPLTACVSAFLGIPGVLLLYAVRLWGLRR